MPPLLYAAKPRLALSPDDKKGGKRLLYCMRLKRGWHCRPTIKKEANASFCCAYQKS